MPFNPSLPLPNSPLESQVVRDQFQALFNLINNIVTLTAAQVDGVTTLPPGTPATVNVSVAGNTLHLSFALPQGFEGAQGIQGNVGVQGPPFANAVVDGVNTVGPGESAQVNVSFDGTNVHFSFDLPRGQTGEQGATGQPGEVSQADLNAALLNTLNQTSANSNAVSALGLGVSDPPTQAQVQALANTLDELIAALRR